MSNLTLAASVLLARSAGSDEVYLVARSINLRFMGGFVAFPGGKLHASDHTLVRGGLTARHVCAVRELFEETGVLLARTVTGEFVTDQAFDAERQALIDDQLGMAEFLARHDLHLEARDLRPAGHLITPPFAPLRFDTAFFVATLPPGQQPTIWPGELTSGFWASAANALDAWRQSTCLLSPPTVSILQALQGHPIEELPDRLSPLLARLDAGLMPPIWFAPGVLMVPLDCQGLPPTTHTNTLLVGTGPTYLIDPGSKLPEELDKLFTVLSGRTVDGIILTHHHPDHIGGAMYCAERLGVPILAHARTRALLEGKVRVDRLIEDDDRLDLGPAPHGPGRWAMQALWTPGHAPGHLALYIPAYQLLLAGDMVSTISSIILLPDDGDLTLYLASLRRLQGLAMRLILPAHGGATARCAELLSEAILHREQREAQLLDALRRGLQTPDELARELYRGFPEKVQQLGALQIQTGLNKLQREGRLPTSAKPEA